MGYIELNIAFALFAFFFYDYYFHFELSVLLLSFFLFPIIQDLLSVYST